MLQKITRVGSGNVDGRCCYWINGCDGLSGPTDWVQEVMKVLRLNMIKHLKHEQRLKIVCFRYSAYW